MTKHKDTSIEEAESQTLSKVDTSKGTYKSFSKMYKDEGYGKQSYLDCMHYCKCALELGKPWFKYVKMWGHVKYLVYEDEHSEIFEQAWASHKKGTTCQGQHSPEPAAPKTDEGASQRQAGSTPRTGNASEQSNSVIAKKDNADVE